VARKAADPKAKVNTSEYWDGFLAPWVGTHVRMSRCYVLHVEHKPSVWAAVTCFTLNTNRPYEPLLRASRWTQTVRMSHCYVLHVEHKPIFTRHTRIFICSFEPNW
jgi:hypothetical protein